MRRLVLFAVPSVYVKKMLNCIEEKKHLCSSNEICFGGLFRQTSVNH